MSELTDAMDAYVDAVNRHRGSLQVGRDYQNPDTPPVELRTRDFIETCCERALPDHVWEFWSHALLDDAHKGWAPYANTLLGPEGLFRLNGDYFIDAPFHPDVQIPLMQMTDWPFLIDRFDAPGELWLGWVGADGDILHRFALTLPEMFSTWTESLDAGLFHFETFDGAESAHVRAVLDDSGAWPELLPRMSYSVGGYVGHLSEDLYKEVNVGVPSSDDYDAWTGEVPLDAVKRRRARFEELAGTPYPNIPW